MAVRRGFSLVEVAFSLGIIVVAVVTVMLVLAAALRNQQRSRMGTVAATIAMTLSERFAQPTDDLRGAQGDWNSRTLDKRTLEDLLPHRGSHLTRAGDPDFETVLLREGMIVPVPNALARRLRSPGDEIGRMLDAGGRLYYLNPAQGQQSQTRNRGTREVGDDTRRLVFGVVGNAQQNTIANHPMQVPGYLLHPYPPRGMHLAGDTDTNVTEYMFLRRWTGAAGAAQPRFTPPPAANPDNLLPGFTGGDLHASKDTFDSHFDMPQHPMGNSWEEQAYIDECAGLAPSASRWRATLPSFWRLVNHHWARIYAQLRASTWNGPGTTITVQRPRYRTVTRTVTEMTIRIDFARNRTYVPVTRTITELVPDGVTSGTITSNAKHVARGVPAPPLGLGVMQAARGSDILHEDAETLARDRWNQVRVGLPGLERRVMYRTAALALWAQASGKGSITEVALEDLATESGTGPLDDPNRIRAGALALADNPLLTRMPVPDPRTIHPTQVMALNFLAHAAIMVTGYQPPFVDERNSLDPALHSTLVLDEDAPYKDPTEGRYYLYHPFFYSGPISATALPDCEQITGGTDPADLATPYTFPLAADATALGEIATQFGVTVGMPAADNPRIARDRSGAPIIYRRFKAASLVRNPFPGPYADRGAFNWRGVPLWTRDADTLRITSHGALPAVRRTRTDPTSGLTMIYYEISVPPMPTSGVEAAAESGRVSDTDMARIALDNALRWSMAYVREHPYDLVVPRPYNAPTAFDRPLFAWDLFAAGGNPLGKPKPAPVGAWNQPVNLYRVLWGGPDARWQMHGAIARNWSLARWFDATANAVPGAPMTSQAGAAAAGNGRYLNVALMGDPNRNRCTRLAAGHPIAYIKTGYDGGNRLMSVYADHRDGFNGVANGFAAGRAPQRNGESPQRPRWWYDQPFDLADRTRQLVFWSVDWLAYEDAESQPSDPVDVSFWYQTTPASGDGDHWQTVFQRRAHPEASLMWANPARDGKLQDPPRGATRTLAGSDDAYFVDTRSDVNGTGVSFTNIVYKADDELPWGRFGTWGADRNGNGVWDRGRVPANARMVAEEVGRFPIYDPVLWLSLGN